MAKKVCMYIMTHDSGMAPNPFHGVCTLALCTPNHVRANLSNEDWIIGIAGTALCREMNPAQQPRKLVYAMKIDRCMVLDSYYRSPEYRMKIPKIRGSRIEMCGDNFYRKNGIGRLEHTGESCDHVSRPNEKPQCQDIAGNRVFIGREYYYFGSMALDLPGNVRWQEKINKQLDKRALGITYIYGGSSSNVWDDADLNQFLEFLESNKLGYIPDPILFDSWDENCSQSSCSS